MEQSNISEMSGGSDWQLSCVEMKQRGTHLLNTGQWSDCTFLVGSEPCQTLVRGHKLILAMASPVFEAMFYGGMAERNDPIPILDVQPEAFKALLEYIYTENINISSFDKACELCYGAKKYMLPHLVKECTKYLWSDLHPKNACRAYEFAKLFEEPVLIYKCIQIICINTMEVLQDSSFEDVELSTMVTVFSLEHLTIESELDLFEAAVRYSMAMSRQSKDSCDKSDDSSTTMPSTSKVQTVNVDSCDGCPADASEATDASTDTHTASTDTHTASTDTHRASTDRPSNETCTESDHHSSAVPNTNKQMKESQSIRSALEQIRFLTLTPHQFAQGPAVSSLLTESESFAVLMNILSSNSDIPMPLGFSTCRVPRKPLIGMATLTVDTPSPVMMEHVCAKYTPPVHTMPEQAERHLGDVSKIYCQRPIIQNTDCLNTSVLDCSVTFMVDKNICLLGVQVPTQVLSEESAVAGLVGGCGSASGYSELLYAHLLDADGARLTYTHYTSRVPYRCLLDIMFNRPVYIQRNKVYKVGIVFNKVGWYPMGTCAQQVAAESVFFNFGIGQTSDSVRDGLIRTIIFAY